MVSQPTLPATPIPCAVICPISLTRMQDPVVTEDGFVFERSAIEAWFQVAGCVNPVTGEPLSSYTLITQPSARANIRAILAANGKCSQANTKSHHAANLMYCPREIPANDLDRSSLSENLFTALAELDTLPDVAKSMACCLSAKVTAAGVPTVHFSDVQPGKATPDGTCLAEENGNPQEVPQYPVDYCSPDDIAKHIPGRVLASGAGNGCIKLWNLTEMESVATLNEHTGRVNCLLDLGGIIASASCDRLIKLWDVESCRNILTLRGHAGGVCCLTRLSPDVLVSGSSDTLIKLWDTRSGTCTSNLAGHGGQVQDLLRVKDGRLVSSSFDKTIRVWDLEAGGCCGALQGHSSWVWSIAELGHDMLASSSTDKSIMLWDLQTLSCEGVLGRHMRRTVSITVIDDGLLASSSSDKKIKLWDTDKREHVITLQGHTEAVHCLVPIENLKLASGSCDNTIRLWDLATGQRVGVLSGHSDGVFSLSLVHCGNTPISL